MDYFPDNLYQAIKKKEINPILIKIYAYQILRGLNYLAMISIAHRDIKPQNILVDNIKHKLIISDFGSAKQLVKSICFNIQHKLIWPTFVQDAIEHLS
jgi:serine/threonine protein kinase